MPVSIPVGQPKQSAQGAEVRIGTGPSFGFKEDPDFLFLGQNESGSLNNATFADSIYRTVGFPFPYGQVFIQDRSGALTERFPFVESLNMGVSFGKFQYNQRISHDFYWTDFQIQDCATSDNINGMQLWGLTSRYKKLDGGHSRSFGYSSAHGIGKPLKLVIKELTDDYDFDKVVIDGIGFAGGGILNSDMWYQCNEFDFDFIAKHADIATNADRSPYFCFINLKNEFYFDSLKNLESQKVENNLKFTMENVPTHSLDTTHIQGYEIIHTGALRSERVYRSQMYALNPNGEYVLNEVTPMSFYRSPTVQPGEIGLSKRKYMTRQQEMAILRNVDHFGIIDNENQVKNFEGWQASQHLEALTGHRMNIAVHFNPDAVAGRTAEVNFKNAADPSKKSMYAGKWLIAGSKHIYTGEKRELATQIELVRSGMQINTDTPLLKKLAADMIS